MNFFEVLYAKKNGTALPANFFDLLFAKSFTPAAEWAEYDGTLPTTYSANGDYLADYRIYGASGGVGDRTANIVGLDTTVFYPVNLTNGQKITMYKPSTGGASSYLQLYDEQKNKIGEFTMASNLQTRTITYSNETDCAYVNWRVTPTIPIGAVLDSTAPSSYVPYGYEVDMSVSDGTTSTTTPIYIGDEPLYEDEYVSFKEQKVYRRTEQLFNAKTAAYKNDVYKNNGGVESSYPGAGYYETYIPITPGETIYAINVHGSTSLTVRLYFYDAQKLWISRTIGYSDAFSVAPPSNAAYAQLQISPQFIPSPNTITITQGSTAPSTYIPYLQPEDPPVPLPALPTFDGTTIVDYAGQSAAPSRFYAKYRKG